MTKLRAKRPNRSSATNDLSVLPAKLAVHVRFTIQWLMCVNLRHLGDNFLKSETKGKTMSTPISKFLIKPMLALALALPVFSTVNVQSADAGHKNKRAAIIAGAIIGGVIAHNYVRHHRGKRYHRHYGHRRYKVRRHYNRGYYRGYRYGHHRHYGKRYYRGRLTGHAY